MESNHYPIGVVFGPTCEMPVELVLLHVKEIGGVLRDGRESDVG